MSIKTHILSKLLVSKVNIKIKRLNNLNIPVLFFITGYNSCGKTLLAKRMLQECNFYQSVNLGLVSKTIRHLRTDIKLDTLDNNKKTLSLYTELIISMANSYFDTGVNVIFEGVQCDTHALALGDIFLGGVVLNVDTQIAIQRGNCTKTHFKRKIQETDYNPFEYETNIKFIQIENTNQNLEMTFIDVLRHLDFLLENKITDLLRTNHNL